MGTHCNFEHLCGECCHICIINRSLERKCACLKIEIKKIMLLKHIF